MATRPLPAGAWFLWVISILLGGAISLFVMAFATDDPGVPQLVVDYGFVATIAGIGVAAVVGVVLLMVRAVHVAILVNLGQCVVVQVLVHLGATLARLL